MESLNTLFDIFSKERRRYALYALDQADGPIGIQELANQVREWEAEEEPVASALVNRHTVLDFTISLLA
ncbi:DUF7344 domain-containing protein [Halostella salina]|uniref:DUF7344 domain-containing protein n=1 Tax=Halostella salina TaxID=1547897 RepID=UPI0013CEEE0F|nr:hypothetical protein [Halostella salina]